MNKKLLLLISSALVIATVTGFNILDKNGKASYTGAPGEPNCAYCHGGGSTSSSGLTITSVPEFSNGNYYADSTYQITVHVSATGFSLYGFDMEILDDGMTNTGTMSSPGTGVKFIYGSAGRLNAVHTNPKSGVNGTTFTFNWTAPSTLDNVNFYAIGNAVNGNNAYTGDYVISPVSMVITGIDAPTPPDPTGIASHGPSIIDGCTVFPNPASSDVRVKFFLRTETTVRAEVMDVSGKIVRVVDGKKMSPGFHTDQLDISGMQSGVYTLRLLTADGSSVQQLISVQ